MIFAASGLDDGLPQSLGRDGPRVDSHSPHLLHALNDTHLFAELGRLDGCFLASRATADHAKIEI